MKPYIIENEELMKEWDWEKNNAEGLNPEKITEGSGRKAWWICKKCGYKWQTKITHRTSGHICPKCAKVICSSNRISNALKNQNLAIIYPDVITQWHPSKNGNLTPDMFSAGSGKKVWWLCDKCGHEWQAQINNRTHSKAARCPKCKQSPYDITNNIREKT